MTDLSEYLPGIENICETIKSKGGTVSASSIRADVASKSFIKMLSEAGQETLTLTPEAGNERLRSATGKIIKDTRIFELCEIAKFYKMCSVKLYFMIGLPSEDRDDIASISGLVKKVSKVIQVGVSVSIFVPKPGTPFESENIISEKDAREKIQFLSSEIKKIKNVKISFESPRIAALQYKLLSFDN